MEAWGGVPPGVPGSPLATARAGKRHGRGRSRLRWSLLPDVTRSRAQGSGAASPSRLVAEAWRARRAWSGTRGGEPPGRSGAGGNASATAVAAVFAVAVDIETLKIPENLDLSAPGAAPGAGPATRAGGMARSAIEMTRRTQCTRRTQDMERIHQPALGGRTRGRFPAVAGLVAVSLLAGCRDVPGTESGLDVSADSPLPDPASFSSQAESDGGMVVSGNPYATHAGLEILEAGGNAVDAAVATAFALAVVEPSQSGLGGRTQALVGLPDGRFLGVDGTTQVPLGYDPATAPSVDRGYPTVAIPGTVKALTRLLDDHGSMPLERVLAPAIGYAERGAPLTPGEARRLAGVAADLPAFPAASRSFLKEDGSPYAAGDTLVQPDLARVLKTLAREGGDAFYTGDLARRMAEDLQANGGFVTLNDLAQYEARDAVLARGSYRGREIVGTYLPASGATVIEILQIMERFPVSDMTEGQRAALLAQALLLGFEDRDRYQFDPPEDAATRLTSGDWAAERAGAVRGVTASVPDAGSPAGEGHPSSVGGGQDFPPEWAHTTHVAVADTQGTVVAMTQSLGPTLGSWVVTPGLGFVYAATTGGYLADVPPGGRPWSSQAPLVVLENGIPRFVLGGAGARRIVSALVSVVSRLLDQGMELPRALAAPRLHPSGNTVTVETGNAPDARTDQVEAALAGLDFQVELEPPSTWFAILNAVEIRRDPGDARPLFLGVSDPRWGYGGAAGPPSR